MEQLLQYFTRQPTNDRALTTRLQSYEGDTEYKTLEWKSDAFATLLRDAGCRRGDRIGCMTEKMSSALISMLGIMKAGCVCVPVQSHYNREQIRFVMLETDSRWLLSDESVSEQVDPSLFETGEISLGWLGDADTLPDDVVAEFVFKNIDQYAARLIAGNSETGKQVFRFLLPGSKKPREEHQTASFTAAVLEKISSLPAVENRFRDDAASALFSRTAKDNQAPVTPGHSCNSGSQQRNMFALGFVEESVLNRLKNIGFIREMKDVYLSFWREIEKENFRRLELQ